MILEPTAYHHKLLYDEAGLIVSVCLTLSPRFPVYAGEAANPNGLSRETEPLVPLAKALDYAAALVAAERERCVEVVRKHGISPFPIDDPNPNAEEINATLQNITAAIREGGEHG